MESYKQNKERVRLVCIKQYNSIEIGEIGYSELIEIKECIYIPIYMLNRDFFELIFYRDFSEHFCSVSELRKKKLEKLNERESNL